MYFEFTDEVKPEYLDHRLCNGNYFLKSLSLSNQWGFSRLGCLPPTRVITAVGPCSPSAAALGWLRKPVLSLYCLPAK